MSWGPAEAAGAAFRLIGKPIIHAVEASGFVFIGTAGAAQVLLELINCRLSEDVRRWKEARLNDLEATTGLVQAERNVRDAAAAANLEVTAKMADVDRTRAEAEKMRAEAEKMRAEAEATRTDAETRRLQAIAAARENLLEKISLLRQHGGDAAFDAENLRQIIKAAEAHVRQRRAKV